MVKISKRSLEKGNVVYEKVPGKVSKEIQKFKDFKIKKKGSDVMNPS